MPPLPQFWSHRTVDITMINVQVNRVVHRTLPAARRGIALAQQQRLDATMSYATDHEPELDNLPGDEAINHLERDARHWPFPF